MATSIAARHATASLLKSSFMRQTAVKAGVSSFSTTATITGSPAYYLATSHLQPDSTSFHVTKRLVSTEIGQTGGDSNEFIMDWEYDGGEVANVPESLLGEVKKMSNEELMNTSTIPGWELVHSPPRKFPRGALVGTVVSDKMEKTVNVAVDRYRIVPKYRKRMRYTRKFMAHDEEELCSMGDLVMITPCQRISRRKHFIIREIIRSKGQL
jgi:small subunit ribosomal protein S17